MSNIKYQMSNSIRGFLRQSWPWALIVFAAMLSVYINTLLPGTAGGDAGELQYAGPLLALTHSNGQPLYVILGFIWSHLVPIGTAAWRMNLLSAVSGAAGCAFLAWLIHRLYHGPFLATMAGLTLGLGSTYWGQAVISDKYAFSAFFASLVTGLALWWSAERSQPYGDRLLYALSLAYGLSLLHHRSMFLFAPGLALLVGFTERIKLWHDKRRLLVCVALVLLPALIVFPLFLPFAQGRSLSPLIWQPVTLPDWLNWWLERGLPAGDMPVFDSSLSWIRQLATYARTLRLDYTLSVVVIAIFGMTVLLRRQPVTVTFLLVTYVLVSALGVNSQGTARPFITYLPSFVLLVYAYGIGLGESQKFMNERIEARSVRIRFLEGLIGFVLVAGILLVQLKRTYPLQRSEATFGQPLDVYRQVLKSGNMGDRLAARMGDLPPRALVLADWEQLTILWYKQKVEGVRPDLALIYPIERLGEFATGDRPLCLTRLLPVGPEWHPTSIGPLVCLSREPSTAVPEGFAPLGATLFTPERAPRLELAAYRLEQNMISAGRYVPLTLAWQALANRMEDYSISLHILTEDWRQVWAQDIAAPVLGMYPTSRWVRDEIVMDYHELAIPPDMAPGRYLWTVVVYRRPDDGSFAQLRDTDGNVEVLGGTFEVVPR